MSKIKSNFNKKVLSKAKQLMKGTFQEFENNIFSFIESRFMSLTEEIIKIEKKTKGNDLNIPIKICKLDKDVPDLIYKEKFDSGLDIVSTKKAILKPLEETILPTGIALAVPIGYELELRPKSSNKKFLVKLGTIDNGYRNEIKVAIVNLSNDTIEIEPYKPIAQLVVNKIAYAKRITYVDNLEELPKSSRDKGGFGSTAKTLSIPLKSLNLKKDDLLGAVGIIDNFNYQLPLEIENLIQIKSIYLNQNIIKGVVKIISDKVVYIEDNVFMIDDKKNKLEIHLDYEAVSFYFEEDNNE